jgi:hypothetical protein
VAGYLEEHGFQLVRVKRMWLDAYYIALLSEQYNGASLPWAFVMACIKGSLSNLHALLGNRPTSSSLFIARKAEP